jgi:hypothetical protein
MFFKLTEKNNKIIPKVGQLTVFSQEDSTANLPAYSSACIFYLDSPYMHVKQSLNM